MLKCLKVIWGAYDFKKSNCWNIFIGFSVSYKILMSAKNPEDFQVLFAPGFNRIFESETGFGLNYTISYLIPFSKK